MPMKTDSNIRKYFIEFGGSMLAYTATLIGVVATRPDEMEQLDTVRAIELLPILPLILAFFAIIRQFRRMDEFYQRIHAEAFALGALVWGIAVMAWGFAENAGAPELSTMFIAPGLLACWGLSLPIILRRYK